MTKFWRKEPLFWVGLLLRVVLLFFFGSSYLRELFIPFLDLAVQSPGSNPWTISPPNYFPYGTVLYAILFVPRFLAFHLFGNSVLGDGALGLALIKGPLLFLDLLTFYILCRIAKERIRPLLFFYWLNPVLIYITYIHGQLDIAATSLALLSLWYIARHRTVRSALALAAATLCKFHVIILIPFILAFVWNRNFAASAKREIFRWIGAWGVASIIGFIPLIFAHRLLYVSAASPEAFRIFAAQLAYHGGQVLYVGLIVVLGMMGRLLLSTRITFSGLFFGSGALLGTLLLATNPMPGWFLWPLPFFALFFAWYETAPRSLYWIMNFCYFLYFVLLQNGSLSAGEFEQNLGLTLLQTSLAGILVAIWTVSLRNETLLQRRAKPAMLGLAGDSGSGKNRLSEVLKDLFGNTNTVSVEGDDYHKWERGHDKWERYTHLHPRANHLASMARHTLLLSQGIPVQQPHYDHSLGRFTDPRELKPGKTVIVQGLHTLYLKGMRDDLDLKIFLMPDPLVRMAWKIDRDSVERGYPIEKILQSLEKREADSALHINPQQGFADWVIQIVPRTAVTKEDIVQGIRPELKLRYLLWNDAPVVDLLNKLQSHGNCVILLDTVPNDINRISVEIEGYPSTSQVEEIASNVFPNLRHLTRSRTAPKWRAGLDGIHQLMTAALLDGMSYYQSRR